MGVSKDAPIFFVRKAIFFLQTSFNNYARKRKLVEN